MDVDNDEDDDGAMITEEPKGRGREDHNGDIPEDEAAETQVEKDHDLWQIQHVLFPSFRRYTHWPAMGKEVVQVANLPDLFRIFERC